jgi:8-oxo-dGTP pyrophosphatase MutT (NUDIX family)
MADADAVLLDERPRGNAEELLDIAWFPLDEALALDLPNVTRFVLGEVQARLEDQARPTPFLRWTRGGARLDHLG